MPRSGTERHEFSGPFRGIMDTPAGSMVPDGFLEDCENLVNVGGALRLRYGLANTGDWVFNGVDGTLPGNLFGDALTMYAITYIQESDIALIQVVGPTSENGTDVKHSYFMLRVIGGDRTGVITSSIVDPGDPQRNRNRSWKATYIRPDSWTLIAKGELSATASENGVVAVRVPDDGFGLHPLTSAEVRPAGGPPNTGATITQINNGPFGISALEAGAYEYVVTTYDTASLRESVPEFSGTDAMAWSAVQGSSLKIYLSGFSLAPGTKYRLYRRRTGNTLEFPGTSNQRGDGVGAQDFYYFVGEFGTPTANNFAENYAGFSVPPTWADFDFANPAPGEAPFYAFIDGLSNQSVGPETAPFNNLPPPIDTQYMAWHRGRAFYVVSNSNIVWFSEPINQRTGVAGSEYVGPNNFFEIPSDNNASITGLWSFGRTLMVFTNNQVFVVNTDTIDTGFPIVEELESAGGCSSYWTIQELPPSSTKPGLLLYAGTNGVYVFDGSSTRNVGAPIQRLIDQAVRAPDAGSFGWYHAAGVVDVRDRIYILNFRRLAENLLGKTTVVYSIDTDSWTRYDVGGFASAVSLNEKANPSLLGGARLPGVYISRLANGGFAHILRFGDQDRFQTNVDQIPFEPSVAFPWSVTIPSRTLGSSIAQKHLQDFAIRFSDNVASSTVQLRIGTDTDVPPFTALIFTHPMSNETLAKFHIGMPSHKVGLKVFGDSTIYSLPSLRQRTAILGYMIDYQVRGYRD